MRENTIKLEPLYMGKDNRTSRATPRAGVTLVYCVYVVHLMQHRVTLDLIWGDLFIYSTQSVGLTFFCGSFCGNILPSIWRVLFEPWLCHRLYFVILHVRCRLHNLTHELDFEYLQFMFAFVYCFSLFS